MRTKQVATATLLCVGLILGSVSSALAVDPTPTPTPTASASASASASPLTYEAQLEAYKKALASYQVELAKYNATWKATLRHYEAAWKATLKQYLLTRNENRTAILNAFQAAIVKAQADFKAATPAGTAADKKSRAKIALDAARNAAISARKLALDALGKSSAFPVKPDAPVKPAAPVKPIAPIKPEATTKPGKSASKTPKARKN